MSDYEKTKKPDECALITEWAARRLAYPLALAARRMGLSANTVTLLGGSCWIASAVTFLLGMHLLSNNNESGGWALLLVTALLWNLGYILDLADGSLARLTNTQSPSGFYLDYVFHLLFKPMFLSSIGFGIYLQYQHPLFLILAVLSIPGNWSASASAIEHVFCQLRGKQKLPPPDPESERGRRILLGCTDIQAAATDKARTTLQTCKAIAQEIFSYYGQFSLFGALLLLDFLTRGLQGDRLLFTTITFSMLSFLLIIRIPMRIKREFRRAVDMDDITNEDQKSRD